jgi:hypothetical protein
MAFKAAVREGPEPGSEPAPPDHLGRQPGQDRTDPLGTEASCRGHRARRTAMVPDRRDRPGRPA